MNIILATDSYKLSHWKQYPQGTETIYSYFESRKGATFPYVVFFGLQPLLKGIAGVQVTTGRIEAAEQLARAHFGSDKLFNRAGWEHIARVHGGRLPLRIRAVPEGTVVPTGNVLMTVENTDPACWWLTNALESYLTHVWYPSTVATLSRHTKEIIANALRRTGDTMDALPFMLQDFGYRGATTHDAAAIGGAAHLVNFQGTDTVPALEFAVREYGADLDTLGFSVPATEHSVMTSLGEKGEYDIVDRLLDEYPSGILSVVADSYNIYNFVDAIATRFKDRILARDGVFVVRPDSTTREHPTAATEVAYLVAKLYDAFGGHVNEHGFKVIDPHVRILWGDGLTPNDIKNILGRLQAAGYGAENIACFGMGGGLLQKVNRDTQRFAFKCSAQKRGGEWYGIQKRPLDASKESKAGRLRLSLDTAGEYATEAINALEHDHLVERDVLETVFEDGSIPRLQTFEEVRRRAALD